MKSTATALTAFAAGLALALPALALPPVLDRAPTDLMVTIVVPKLSGLEKDVNNLITTLGLPGAGAVGVEMALQSLGIEQGVNLDGGLCFCVTPPVEPGDTPDLVVLAPVSDYKAFLDNFGVKPAEGGVDTVLIRGEEAFVKNLGGGYVALGPAKARVEKTSGDAKNAGVFKTMIGKRAEAILDAGDIGVILNVAVAKPVFEKQIDKAKDAPGMIPEEVVESGVKAVKTVLENTTAIVGTFDASAAGVSLDIAFACKEDGEFGKYLKKPGNSTALLDHLPAGPFLAAAAVDTSSADFKALMHKLIGFMPKEQANAMADQVAQMNTQIDLIDGHAATVGYAPGGLQTGLLAATVAYTATKEPAKVIASIKAQIDSMVKNDKGTGKFEENITQINGVKVDAYEMKPTLGEDVPPQVGGVMSGLFGALGGPAGYLAQVEGGTVRTFAKKTSLMAEAIKAAKGENTLGKDKAVTQVGEKLPKGRVAELYIGATSLFDTVKPFAVIPMPQLGKIEVPRNLPPLGMCLAPGDSTLQGTLFLPMPLLKFIADTAQKVNNGGGDDGGQPSF